MLLLYNTIYLPEELGIHWWEKLLLRVKQKITFETDEAIIHYKILFGKFYLLDFRITKGGG